MMCCQCLKFGLNSFSEQHLSLEESWSVLSLFEKSNRGRITDGLDLRKHGMVYESWALSCNLNVIYNILQEGS